MRIALIVPWLLVFAFFWFIPIALTFVFSLTDYTYFSGPDRAHLVGFQNYIAILSDPDFRNACLNTVIFAAGTVPVTLVLAVGLAALLRETRFMQTLFKVTFFMPSILSITVLCMIFDQWYARGGILTRLAHLIGINSAGLLLEPGSALYAIMGMDVFVSIGYYTILFLAAMQTITPDLFDNARLMGTNFFQRLIWIIIPMIRPMILFAVVINTIKSLQIFTEIYILTKGGPLQSTETVVFWMYKLGFERFDTGYASAMAYVLLGITAAISWIQIRWLKESQVTA